MNRTTLALTPILSAALLLGSSLPASGQGPAAAEIAARTAPAVVSIRALSAGVEVASGSGFVIRADGVIVTNLHVVEEGTSLEVELATGETFTDVYVLGTDDRRDLAVLKLPTSRLTSLEPGDPRALAVGDAVYVMGNPMGLERTFSDGLVSAHRVLDGVAYLQISAPISSGSSGGPVLNAAGEVVGVATATLADGQNLNLAVPMTYAEGLLEVAGAPEPFTEVAARWNGADGAGGGASGIPAADDPFAVAQEDLSALPPWQAIVVRQLRGVEPAMVEEGYARYRKPHYALLAPDSLDRTVARLKAGEYRAIAVCDGDCRDVDLMVSDAAGEVLGMDVLDDDYPIVDFETPGGEVELTAKMIQCSTDVCYYGVQLFRKR